MYNNNYIHVCNKSLMYNAVTFTYNHSISIIATLIMFYS